MAPQYIHRLSTTKLYGIIYCSEKDKMSQCMRFPTMWYVRPAKPQISLRIRAV